MTNDFENLKAICERCGMTFIEKTNNSKSELKIKDDNGDIHVIPEGYNMFSDYEEMNNDKI